MKQVSARLRMSLAQYRELAAFAQFGSDLDDNTRKVLDAGDRMMAALRQRRFAPLSDAHQALMIFAVGDGFADKIQPEQMELFETKLFEYFDSEQPELMAVLETGKKMDEQTLELLRERLGEFASGLNLSVNSNS